MKDSIILGTGNSRYLKSVEDFKSLYPTYDDFVAALVSGTLPVDFNGINPAGFQQVGNPLGKAALLKDDTAALYGLPNTAVPDDALRLLAPAVSHWWRRRSYQMVEERTALPNELNYIAYGSNADNCVRDVQYASEVALFYGGGVELIDPQEVQVKWNDGDATTEVLKGMYVFGTYSHPDDVLYFDTDEVFSVNSSSSAYWVRSINTASYLVSAKAEYGAWEYVHSSDEDAYPHSGAADGYEYEYLGQPYPPKAGSGGTGTCSVLSVNGKTGDVKLTAGDIDAIPSPATASVGQTIVVKAVDEAGKPTEWEAADMIGESNYELIEKIVVGYAITTSEPDDWADNWTAYYTNEGTMRDPDYVALSGDAAPAWEAGKYYAYSADGVTKIERKVDLDGKSYSFKRIAVFCVPVDSSKLRFDLWYGNDSNYNYVFIPISNFANGKNGVAIAEDAGFNVHPMMRVCWGNWHKASSPNNGYEVKQSYQETGYLSWGAKYDGQPFYKVTISGIDTTTVIPSGVIFRILGERV